MRTKFLSLIAGLLFASILSGCGGSSSSGQSVSTGVYKDAGIVSGLQYKTATQSGVTDKDGTFRYVPGETVTFSVSNVVIGQVAGAGTITTFDLVGITPPTSSSGIPLNNPASKKFQEAANISLFLQTLDDDSNPTNGINIPSAANNVVANTPINFKIYADFFNVKPYNGFGESPQFKVFIGSCRTAKVWSGGKAIAKPSIALNNIYKGLGISPNVYFRSKSTYSDNTSVNFEYGISGLVSKENSNYDPTSTINSYTTYTYDANGNKTYEIYTHLTNPTSNYSLTYTYDLNGNQIRRVNTDNSGRSISSLTSEYDINGNVTKSQRYSGDVLEAFSLYLYNSNGTLSREDYYNADGSLNYSWSYSYDANLLPTNIRFNDTTSSSSNTFVYDASQQVIQLEYFIDGALINTMTLSYDVNGNPLLVNLSGRINYRTDYSWDNKGLLLSSTDYDQNNQMTATVVYTYDNNGNCINTKVTNADGSSSTTTTTYLNQTGWGDILNYFIFGSPT